MFESLIDHLETSKWEEKQCCDKKQDDFVEYHVLRNHKALSDTSYQYLIAVEDGDPITVDILDCKGKHDPLKGVGMAELKLDADKKHILGIDVNGDIVMRKS